MELAQEALGPLIPENLAKSTMQMLGRPKERFHEPAPWIRQAVRRSIANTGWMPLDRRHGESRSSAVARWSLSFPFFVKSQEGAAAVARESGIEYRTPILDPRVIALAATRPRWEKRSGVRSKSLLRAAMKGMLPEEVLWPRLYKTGLTKDYLMRCVQQEFPLHADALRRESVLADLGVIDPTQLSKAIAESASDRKGWIAAHLYYTFQVEYWLRARLAASGGGVSLDDARSQHGSRSGISHRLRIPVRHQRGIRAAPAGSQLCRATGMYVHKEIHVHPSHGSAFRNAARAHARRHRGELRLRQPEQQHLQHVVSGLLGADSESALVSEVVGTPKVCYGRTRSVTGRPSVVPLGTRYLRGRRRACHCASTTQVRSCHP